METGFLGVFREWSDSAETDKGVASVCACVCVLCVHCEHEYCMYYRVAHTGVGTCTHARAHASNRRERACVRAHTHTQRKWSRSEML